MVKPWLNHIHPVVIFSGLNPLPELQPVVATAVLNDALNCVVTELVLAVGKPFLASDMGSKKNVKNKRVRKVKKPLII